MRNSIMDMIMIMLLISLVAATAGPRLSNAASENRLAQMIENLHKIRSHIEVYRMENGGLLPGQDTAGADVSSESFRTCLTGRDSAGRARLKAIPANPFMNGEAAHRVTCVNSIDALPTGLEETGWWFNAATGQFRACSSRFHSAY